MTTREEKEREEEIREKGKEGIMKEERDEARQKRNEKIRELKEKREEKRKDLTAVRGDKESMK